MAAGPRVAWQRLIQDWLDEDAATDARFEKVRRAYQSGTLDEFLEADDKERYGANDDSGQPGTPDAGAATPSGLASGPAAT